MGDKIADQLAFMRITVIGASGSGKTCLVNAFCNNHCPSRYIRTEKANVYYKMVQINEDGEDGEKPMPVLVEIEDTPGSEKGFDDGDDAAAPGAHDDEKKGEVKVKKGARVSVLKNAAEVTAAFASMPKLQYRPAIDGMLGKEYSVKTVSKDGKAVGLPSPDGSEGGVWSFPLAAVKLKVSLELPIDQFLSVLDRTALDGGKKKAMPPKERKAHAQALKRPLEAYERPIGTPEVDKTLTKNRMGFFICFDMSDDTGAQLREAMALREMLKKALAARKASRLSPFICLVGTKADKTEAHKFINRNRESATDYSDREEIPFVETSSRLFHRVKSVFHEMMQAISQNEVLWKYSSVDDQDDEGEEVDGGCAVA